MKTFHHREGAAIVSGGTGALGAATTRLLAERGSDVVFAYHANDGAAKELCESLTTAPGRVEARQLDLTDTDAAAELVGDVAAKHGGLHTVVYASGPFVPMTYLSNATPDDLRRQLESDAVAFYNLVHPALVHLRTAGGSVVAVATTALTRAIVLDGLSAGPKGAVEGLVRTLALEEGRFGLRANCVGVGMTKVGMAAELIESGVFGEGGEHALANIPMRRFGTADDVAEAVCFLASDAAGFISGQTLNVDGAYSA